MKTHLMTLPRSISLPWLLLGAAFLASGCEQTLPDAAKQATPRAVPEMEAVVLKVEQQNWPTEVTVQGSLIADEVAIVGAEVAGRVDNVLVDFGDRVKAGEPLVKLETAEFQLQIDQAEAELMQSRAAVGLAPFQSLESLDPKQSPPVLEQKATWDEARTRSARIQQLYQQNAVTDTDLETAAAAEGVAAARYASAVNAVNEKLAQIRVRSAALALAKQHLDDAAVMAPFDCYVQERHVAPGNYVQVGQALVTVVRADPLRFRGTIPERYAQLLQRGQALRLLIDATGKHRTVKITRISPSLDIRSRALTFEAEVQNADGALRDGLFTEGKVILDPKAEQLAVPRTAVVEFAGVEKVWKVVDGLTQEQVVQTGERREGSVEILKGLKPGDHILLNGEQGQIARIRPLEPSETDIPQATSLVENPEDIAVPTDTPQPEEKSTSPARGAAE